MDSLNNVIEGDDLSPELSNGLSITVSNNDPDATQPTVGDLVVHSATQPDGTVIAGGMTIYTFSPLARWVHLYRDCALE